MSSFAQFLGAQFTPGMIASGDFTNIATNNAADGVYTLNGSSCTIGDIIDMESSYTSFDPVIDIDSDGIKPRDNGSGGTSGRTLAVTPELFALLVPGGFTVILDFTPQTDLGVSIALLSVDENEWAEQGIRFVDGPGPVDHVVLSDPSGGESATIEPANMLEGQLNRCAISVTDSYVSASINGSDVVVLGFGGITVNTATIFFSVGGALDARLSSFAFDQLAADADLPTLSAL
jgi:hypothetical protein